MKSRGLITLIFVVFAAVQTRASGMTKLIVLVVWEGIRPDFVSLERTTTLWQLRTNGVFLPIVIPHTPPPPKVNSARWTAFSFCGISRVGSIALMGISLQQFEQMKARVTAPRRKVVSAELVPARRATINQIILGIDPSLRGTGFGVISTTRGEIRMLTCGTIKCAASLERSRCLAKISQMLREVIQTHKPTVCAIEGLFFAQNLQTALIMGEARGAAMAVVAEAGLGVYEIAPRKVKQAIVGYGAAQKLAVAKMVQRMINLPELPAPDAADALALALTYAQTNSGRGLGAPKRI